jgi:hypothetical protein
MSQPGIVQTELDDESVLTRVDFGGDDALFVTPTRLVVYRSEGLLSDESVETYPHGAERITVSEGRRKSTLTLDYGLDGERTLSVPTAALEETLHPVLASTLEASGRLDDDESVERTFRFSELTLIVTSARLVKHVGAAVWDTDVEEYPFESVTDLTFEEGSVATSIVLTLGDRQERFKAPNDEARLVRESIRAALLTYHDATSLDELRAAAADRRAEREDGEADADDPRPDTLNLGGGPEPLSANPRELPEEDVPDVESDHLSGDPIGDVDEGTRDSRRAGSDAGSNRADASAGAGGGSGGDGSAASEEATATEPPAGGRAAQPDSGSSTRATAEGNGPPDVAGDATDSEADPDAAADGTTGTAGQEADDGGFASSGFRPADGEASVPAEVAAELRELRETVETQGERLDRQAELIEQLIAELRRGR